MVCSLVGVGSIVRGSGGVAEQPCLPQTSSGVSAVTASTSAWVRLMLAAARFSWRCWTLVVAGVGSAVGGRGSCQGGATCCGGTAGLAGGGAVTAGDGAPSGRGGAGGGGPG